MSDTTDQLKTGPLVLIEQALQQAQIGREEIQRLGIGIGPGYTGIRSAIAVAQGWQLARDTELCAVAAQKPLPPPAATTFAAKPIYHRCPAP